MLFEYMLFLLQDCKNIDSGLHFEKSGETKAG